ncbi:proline-rich Akt substrate 40 kDa isoform X2 [Lycorma delicatula]|uniref:proline-rich Akt substrate 40 kDa isoform X2 n=1 Tax=Lycorma delicatula TaxID=130591 RepID=UPI003F513D82
MMKGVGTVELLGISKEQSVLVEVISIGSWVIHRCLNCQTYTHALNRDKGAASLLVNKSLITDPNLIAELKNGENFSPVFHIIINYSEDDDVFTKATGTGHHQAGVAALRQVLTTYVQRESILTEERVRTYTDQQYAILENLRARAHRDHRSLTKLLNESGHDSGIINRPGFTNTTTTFSNTTSNPVILASASAAIKKPVVQQQSSKQKIVQSSGGVNINTGISDGSSNINTNRRFSESRSQSNLSFDSEVLFPLEGMEDPASDNYHTDEERSDTDDSGSHDEGIHIPRRVGSFIYAKSLPVNVPTFINQHANSDDNIMPLIPGDIFDTRELINEHRRSPRQPMDIAASIKALAKSVHGDAVFGDLPRPRFSSQI